MIEEIKSSCNECNKEIIVFVPQTCWKCNPLHKVIKDFEKEVRDNAPPICIKSPKWRERKRFAYHMLLYMVPVTFITVRYGLFEELLWIFGGLYVIWLPCLIQWLMKKF